MFRRLTLRESHPVPAFAQFDTFEKFDLANVNAGISRMGAK